MTAIGLSLIAFLLIPAEWPATETNQLNGRSSRTKWGEVRRLEWGRGGGGGGGVGRLGGDTGRRKKSRGAGREIQPSLLSYLQVLTTSVTFLYDSGAYKQTNKQTNKQKDEKLMDRHRLPSGEHAPTTFSGLKRFTSSITNLGDATRMEMPFCDNLSSTSW